MKKLTLRTCSVFVNQVQSLEGGFSFTSSFMFPPIFRKNVTNMLFGILSPIYHKAMKSFPAFDMHILDIHIKALNRSFP